MAPIKARCNDVLAPDMQAAQRKSGGERLQPLPGRNARKAFQPDHIRLRHKRGDFIKARLRLGKDRLALLMKQGGEEQELRVLDLEPAGSLDQSAFAQDNDLLAAQQRIDDDGPLFKCMSQK